MEGFTKIPNTVFELDLTPSQFTVLCNLIRVQSYREYKGEVEDGWFSKSQNELAKECGFKSRKTLAKVLNTMVKNTIVNFTIDKKGVTKFKITMVNNTIVKNTIANNTIDTMTKNTIPTMVNFTTLHNNSNKNKEQDNSINPEVIVDTSTSTNNNTTHSEEKEEENNMTCMTSHQDDSKVETTGKKSKVLLESFVDGDNSRFPTIDELRAIFILENINFSNEDFKYNSSGLLEGKYKLSPKYATMSVLKYLKPAITNHGYLCDSDNKDIQNAVISYINKNKLNVVIGNNY